MRTLLSEVVVSVGHQEFGTRVQNNGRTAKRGQTSKDLGHRGEKGEGGRGG